MDFMTRMKEVLSHSMEGSKDFLEKARDKVHDFGETSVIRLEIRQLEGQAKQELTRLGTKVYELLVDEGKGSVSSKTPEVKEYFQRLEEIKESIAAKEQLLPKDEKDTDEAAGSTGVQD
ncbi:hypothetical protein [Spirochaeta africana]|uniref:Uncharacterized protein n=1 Tax=Spirochaeta africana (strain ATCC 700263 / DSM 8902 / Z-7692) TaxID=889378 RepID=H9UKZ5_SPIAZ|nr:hypothetical protein [Spirochaeta africana]AFG38188.1 hypothetical protein Spiaf_2148 [Spirochaeta africana DSM 8902]